MTVTSRAPGPVVADASMDPVRPVAAFEDASMAGGVISPLTEEQVVPFSPAQYVRASHASVHPVRR